MPYRRGQAEAAQETVLSDTFVGRLTIRVVPVEAGVRDVEARMRMGLAVPIGTGVLTCLVFVPILPTMEWDAAVQLALGAVALGLGMAALIWVAYAIEGRQGLGVMRVDQRRRQIERRRGFRRRRWQVVDVPEGAMMALEPYLRLVGLGRHTQLVRAAQVGVQVGARPTTDDLRRQRELLADHRWRRPPAPIDDFECLATHLSPELAKALAQTLGDLLDLEVADLTSEE